MSFISVESEFKFQSDLERLRELQFIFGTRGKILSYDPAPERWRWEEMARTMGGLKAREEFFKYQTEELRTALKERYNVSESPVTYSLDSEGRIYNELLPNEPFEEILLRGIVFRKENGSKEEERELCELEGYLKVCEKLFDKNTPVGTKIMVISPPGLVDGSPYKMNFVDIYEKKGDGEIKMTRFSSGTEYEEYIQIAEKLEPDYFSGSKAIPLDAWFLANPIELKGSQHSSPKQVFEGLFEDSIGTTSKEDFQKIYEVCLPFVLNFIDELIKKNIDIQKIRVAFKAVFNRGDIEKERLNSKTNDKEILWVNTANMQDQLAYFGSMIMRSVNTGCGLLADFNEAPIMDSVLLANSVGRFGLTRTQLKKERPSDEKDDRGFLWFECPNGHWNKRERGKELKKVCDTCECDVSCKH